MVEEMYCAMCRDESVFELPPCADGHGADCADRACTGCGAAIVGAGWGGVVAVRRQPAAA